MAQGFKEICLTGVDICSYEPSFSGVVKDILEQMIKRAAVQKIERMTLEVRVSNITAIKLYEKFGFVTLGVRPKYYENGEDALIMWMEVAHAD